MDVLLTFAEQIALAAIELSELIMDWAQLSLRISAILMRLQELAAEWLHLFVDFPRIPLTPPPG